LLHGLQVRAKAAVHAEDLLVDDRRDREAVEAVRERLPELNVVPSLACPWPRQHLRLTERLGRHTLVVETIDTVDACALVVAAEDEEVLRVLDLVRKQEADCLQRLLPAIDVVAEKEVVGFGREATVLEQSEEVVVLSVDVACRRNEKVSRNKARATYRRSLWVPRARGGWVG
jgi:hypothetical protein